MNVSQNIYFFFVLTLIASCCQDMLPPRFVSILFGVEFWAAPHSLRVQNRKASENVIEKWGTMFDPQQAAELGSSSGQEVLPLE